MESLRFVHLSDLHFRKQYEDWGFQNLLSKLPDSLGNLAVCLEREKAEGLDFVLLTGDLSHDGTEEDYMILRDALNHTLGGTPWVALPGNHDDRAAFAAGLLEQDASRKCDTVYHIKGFRVIMLDTGDGISGRLEKSQVQWLRNILSVPSEKGSILAVHHSLIDGQEGLGGIQADADLPDLIASSDVIGIFCGHTHHNYAGTYAGKPYFTADSMSYVMEESGPDTYLKAVAAYNCVVYCGGALSVQVRQLVPAPAVAACFSTDTLSSLFEKRK